MRLPINPPGTLLLLTFVALTGFAQDNPDPAFLTELKRTAIERIFLGDFEAAEGTLQELKRIAQSDPEIQGIDTTLSSVYALSPAEAERFISLVKMVPMDLWDEFSGGAGAFNSGDYSRAGEYFERCENATYNDAAKKLFLPERCLAGKIASRAAGGIWDSAIAKHRPGTVADPEESFGEAVAAADRLIQMRPSWPTGYLLKAKALASRKKNDAARQIIENFNTAVYLRDQKDPLFEESRRAQFAGSSPIAMAGLSIVFVFQGPGITSEEAVANGIFAKLWFINDEGAEVDGLLRSLCNYESIARTQGKEAGFADLKRSVMAFREKGSIESGLEVWLYSMVHPVVSAQDAGTAGEEARRFLTETEGKGPIAVGTIAGNARRLAISQLALIHSGDRRWQALQDRLVNSGSPAPAGEAELRHEIDAVAQAVSKDLYPDLSDFAVAYIELEAKMNFLGRSKVSGSNIALSERSKQSYLLDEWERVASLARSHSDIASLRLFSTAIGFAGKMAGDPSATLLSDRINDAIALRKAGDGPVRDWEAWQDGSVQINEKQQRTVAVLGEEGKSFVSRLKAASDSKDPEKIRSVFTAKSIAYVEDRGKLIVSSLNGDPEGYKDQRAELGLEPNEKISTEKYVEVLLRSTIRFASEAEYTGQSFNGRNLILRFREPARTTSVLLSKEEGVWKWDVLENLVYGGSLPARDLALRP